jgi:hypothetical protein
MEDFTVAICFLIGKTSISLLSTHSGSNSLLGRNALSAFGTAVIKSSNVRATWIAMSSPSILEFTRTVESLDAPTIEAEGFLERIN